MPHKSKQIVWHKKTGKFIPAKFLKVREKTEQEKNIDAQPTREEDRMKDFFLKFKQEIHKAL